MPFIASISPVEINIVNKAINYLFGIFIYNLPI